MSNSYLNKRSEARINCNKAVQVFLSDETQMNMTALNYSMGGIGVTGSVYQVIPQVGEKLRVLFTVGESSARNVDVSGTVKHINLNGGVYYLGIAL